MTTGRNAGHDGPQRMGAALTTKTYTPIDPTPLARTVVLWIWIDLFANVAAIAANAYHVRALGDLPADTPVSFWDGAPDLGDVDGLVFLGLAPCMLSLFVAGFLCLKWIYRVNRNAHVLAPAVTVRPAWAIGWFFVPFANLLMPFRGVAQAWRAAADPERWRTVELPSLLRVWWGLWLVFSAVDNLSFRTELRATDLSGLAMSDYFTITASVLRIPLDFVFLRVVQRLTVLQAQALNRHTFA